MRRFAVAGRSAGRRLHDGVGGLLRLGGVVPIGWGQVLEAAFVAHDGAGGVGQAGEVARQVADVRPAAVLVTSDAQAISNCACQQLMQSHSTAIQLAPLAVAA